MSVFTAVSEDVYNRSQSWYFAGVYRNESGAYRVEIRANAYEEQSHATVSAWKGDGWAFHTLVPTGDWYGARPSYTKPALEERHLAMFHEVRDELLRRLAKALYKGATGKVEIR